MDDYGMELLISAIITKAVADHMKSAKKLRKAEKILQEYDKVAFLVRRAHRYKVSGKMHEKNLASRIFRIVLKKDNERYQLEKAGRLFTDCELFFTSEYFSLLSPTDGNTIIRILREKEKITEWEVNSARYMWKNGYGHRDDNR